MIAKNVESIIRYSAEQDTRFETYSNFDCLRLIAAAAVMFSHAFLIAEGTEENEPFVRMLGERNIIGIYGVMIFLILSGFLVSRSAEMSRSVPDFLWRRALRIYPGLAVCGLVLGLAVAPFFSSLGAREFAASGIGIDYALRTVLVPGAVSVETVSFYPGWVGEVIAGTLWTIPQEILCYLLLAGLLLLSMNRPTVIAWLLVAALALRMRPEIWNHALLGDFLFLVPSFLSGCLLWRARGGLNAPTALLGLVATIVLALAGGLLAWFPLVAAYPFMYFATSKSVRLPSLRRIGDLSYGLYLYGWPVAQVCRALLGSGTTWWEVWLCSTVATVPIAWLSWHLVERPALALKPSRIAVSNGT